MDRPNRTASMRTGTNDSTGPACPRLSSRSPQPYWKTATSTPKDAAAASRFITAATAGISRLRKASISRRNPRTSSAPTTCAPGPPRCCGPGLEADPAPARPLDDAGAARTSRASARRPLAGRTMPCARIGPHTPSCPVGSLTSAGPAASAALPWPGASSDVIVWTARSGGSARCWRAGLPARQRPRPDAQLADLAGPSRPSWAATAVARAASRPRMPSRARSCTRSAGTR
jgi:hypothetical protein